MRPDHAIELLQFTRVPCLGEIVYLRENTIAHGVSWRVTDVKHIPPRDDVRASEVVAEICCVAAD